MLWLPCCARNEGEWALLVPKASASMTGSVRYLARALGDKHAAHHTHTRPPAGRLFCCGAPRCLGVLSVKYGTTLFRGQRSGCPNHHPPKCYEAIPLCPFDSILESIAPIAGSPIRHNASHKVRLFPLPTHWSEKEASRRAAQLVQQPALPATSAFPPSCHSEKRYPANEAIEWQTEY